LIELSRSIIGFLFASLLLCDLSLAKTREEDPNECIKYSFEKVSSGELSSELFEMSGLLVLAPNELAHVQDSGNEPLLILTELNGKVKQRIRFAKTATDPEELTRGVCPWGTMSCIYVMDTGDNLGWRAERMIWAIEEASMKSSKPRIEGVSFTFPGGERLDSEAAALVGRTIYMFSKEKKHARVFALDIAAFEGGSRQALLVADLPYSRLTGASATKDGSRLLLLNGQGAIELSKEGKGAKEGDWYPFRRKISLTPLAQQEAIAYDEDQRSFYYSSEKKAFFKHDWGIMHADCVRKP
jgi:hypothetical protein